MSVHEVLLPSPPPDTSRTKQMSGLFARTNEFDVRSDDLTDGVGSDGEIVTRKRVEFQPWTTNIREPQLSTPNSETTPSLKSLPPSRDCQANTRPILKTKASSECVIGFGEHNESKPPIDNMDSLLNHLVMNERSTSIDAYQTMTSLIKSFDEPPEHEVLQRKMARLQLFIKRDLVVLDANTDLLPNEERLGLGNLVMSALKVLVTMVWSPTYSPCLTDDFRTWALDRAIQVLKDHATSKAVLLHYMHLLATQNFRSSMFTNNTCRALRVLEVLQDLTDHVSGKAVMAERLLVYQKLIEQAKIIMEKKPDMWMKNLLTAMGHSFKEVRNNAVSAGAKACTAFTENPAVTSAARRILEESSGERTLSISITNRLERVLAAKDEANQVPQIWTVVLMLCNGRHSKLETWPQLHNWLKLIQRCFNCSDNNVRIQAFMAWNRLYFVAKPHEASEKVVAMLVKPSVAHLDRTGMSVTGKGSRQAVVSSYCMLLYYAFRPSITSQQCTRMWNDFVVKVLTSSFLSRSAPNCDLSCRVLSALFYNSHSASRVWNENRAHENAPFDPRELPTIDSKWIRTHTTSILSVMRLLIELSSFGPDGTVSDQSYIAQAWRSLMQAIRESSSKEVMVSADSKASLQSIFNFLSLTDQKPNDTTSADALKLRAALLTRIAIAEIGPSAMMQALENIHGQRVNIVLQEMMMYLCRLDDESSSQQSARRLLFHRCLTHIVEDVYSNIQSDAQGAQSKQMASHTLNHCLQSIPMSEGTSFVLKHQKKIASIFEFPCKCLTVPEGTNDLSSVHATFCTAIVSILLEIDVTEYLTFDRLIAAVLTSTHINLGEKLLRSRDRSYWQAHNAMLGLKTLQAVTRLSDHPYLDSTQRQNDSRLESTSRSSFIWRLKQKAPSGRPCHDDSQVQFVSIESSPPDYDQLESQLLTERQKEVRLRQDTERTLTFADIRTSPSAKHVKAQPTRGNDQIAQSPELLTTPTLPKQRAREEVSQSPTPTPRARKLTQRHLQPDIASSPPSVVNGDDRGTLVAITSSPVKGFNDADGAVQLAVADDMRVGSDALNRAIEDNAVSKAFEPIGESLTRRSSPEIPTEGPPEAIIQSSAEEYETAIADASSPISDEYDALAASQLSRSLVEENNFVVAYPEGDTVSSQASRSAGKRKRQDYTIAHDSKHKRRRSDKTLKTPGFQELTDASEVISGDTSNAHEEEMEDCIVVNTSSSPAHRSSKQGRSSQQAASNRGSSLSSSPAPLQAPRNSTDTTPSSQKSSGKRRLRSRRKTSSQPRRDSDPVTQIPIFNKLADSETVIDSEMATVDEDILPMPALRPRVVVKVPQLQRESLSPVESLAKLPNKETAEGDPDNRWSEIIPAEQAPSDIASRADLLQPVQLDQGTTTGFDAVESLRDILKRLNASEKMYTGKSVDLTAIHSLCFQIGLKAQQLAQQ